MVEAAGAAAVGAAVAIGAAVAMAAAAASFAFLSFSSIWAERKECRAENHESRKSPKYIYIYNLKPDYFVQLLYQHQCCICLQ